MKKTGMFAVLLSLAVCQLAGCADMGGKELPTVAFSVPEDLIGQEDSTLPVENLVKIGISQAMADADMDEIYAGFIDGMEAAGYVDGSTIVFDYNIGETEDDCMIAADRMVNEECQVILAIGETAVSAAKNRTQDIPIVAAGISDMVEAGFVKTEQTPGKNITGVSSAIEESVQVDLIRKLYPKASKVMVLYSASVDSRYQTDKFATACLSRGLKVDYEQVADSEEIRKILLGSVENTEVVYSPSDEIVFSNMADAAGVCNDNKIPFFCNSADMVTYGSLAAALPDYYNIGQRAAAMLVKILEGTGSVSSMPVEHLTLEECKVYFNTTTAEIIELEIPEEYQKQQ
jgi:putative ABC transport system substrate-binding protein